MSEPRYYTVDAQYRDALRRPFDPAQVGKLPKVTQKDAPKTKCAACGNYIQPHIHVDFVGHANVTDRLNHEAPDWYYTIDRITEANGHITGILGTMTLGGKSIPEAGAVERQSVWGEELKLAVSDFVVRAAMRFGVGLDLWIKGEAATYESADAVQSIQTAQGLAPVIVSRDSIQTAQGVGAGGSSADAREIVASVPTSSSAGATAPDPVSSTRDDASHPAGATVGAGDDSTVTGNPDTRTTGAASRSASTDPAYVEPPAPATVDEAAAPVLGEGAVAAAASPLHTFVGDEHGPCEVCHWLAEAPIHVIPTRARA